MKRITSICFLLAALLTGGACSNGNDDSGNGGGKELPGALNPVTVTKTNPMKVYAHYMPWFETPATNNDKWGQHWTMATCNPDRQNSNGRREIAAHYYPQIGPYASSDAIVLNYHALLMKYSGIDGVMIDWYGIQDKHDYAANKRNTEELVKAVERVGLDFAIVYEDATLSDLSDAGKVTQAQADLKYLESQFFKKSNYIRVNNQPLLMIFGPQQVSTPKEWTTIFSALEAKPAFVVLNGFSGKANNSLEQNAIGEFLWVNPAPNYSDTGNFGCYIGGAMPGFHDYYREGGWGDGYTTYDAENGALFNRQLDAARKAGLKYLQISTWNDFGEGTTIEPTLEYGNRYLTALQQFTGISYQEKALQEIYRWYTLKLKYTNDKDKASKYLTQAFYYFISLQPDKAGELMDELE